MESVKGDNIWDKKYKFIDNLKYMLKMHWNFDKAYVFLPIAKILTKLLLSIITMYIPMIILDALTENKPISWITIRIVIASIGTIFLSIINTTSESQIMIGANKFFVLNNFYELAKKKMTMDYELYSSPQGKLAAKKAQSAVQGNINVGITSFYIHFTEIIMNLLGFITYAAIIASLNPLIILLLLLTYALDGLIALSIEKFAHKTKDKREEIERKSLYLTYRTCNNGFAKDIRIYTMSKWLSDIKEQLLSEGLHWQKDLERKKMLQLFLEGLLVFLRDGAAYSYLIYMMIKTSDMSVGTFSVYLMAIAGFGNWLLSMVNEGEALVNAHYAVSDYRNFMEKDDAKPIDHNSRIRIDKKTHSIRLKNVCYQYPGSNKKILDNINLEIKENEKIAIVGVNGAGKTTLIKIICKLLTPTSGEVLLDNINIKYINQNEYFKLISAVFQDICVLPISIKDNIIFSDKTDDKKLNQCISQAGLSNKISDLEKGINTKLIKQFHADGTELSGGEMQMLLLARALYKDAPILILDEPTAALDPIAENKLYLKYNELTKNKTSIYISHRLSSTRFCDRIIFLDGGKIAEIGTQEELMKHGGKYAAMYETSGKYYHSKEKEVVYN